jgi:hypothetical protein
MNVSELQEALWGLPDDQEVIVLTPDHGLWPIYRVTGKNGEVILETENLRGESKLI